MTASLHKLSAGDGYTYLTDQVAANDSTERSARDRLVDYYHARGEKPGVWKGKGLAALGITAGETVRENQMKALFGEGLHPNADAISEAAIKAGATQKEALAAARLGRKFGDANAEPRAFVTEVARRFRAWNEAQGLDPSAAIPGDVRADLRSSVGRELFESELGRAPADARELAGYIAKASRPREQSVAGFDITFSPVKSVSTLWAVAPREVAQEIQAAHDAAIDQAMAWLEREASYTRRGAGGVRQVDIEGLVMTRFEHRDSRAGDPDLHTHVVVSNKVRAVEDGKWLALDGAMIYQATVTASEHYNAALEAELTARLGVQFAARARSDGRQPVREITGVDPGLNERWSSRRAAIEARQKELAAEFQDRHARPASPAELRQLAQQANLETRQRKHEPRSEHDQRTAWANEAAERLGNREAIEQMVQRALNVDPQPVQWSIESVAEATLRQVENTRATWTDTHLRSRALAELKSCGLAPAQLNQTADAVVAHLLTKHPDTVEVSRTDPIAEPEPLRRRDGSSVYARAHSRRWTSRQVVAAEEAVLTAARQMDGHRCDPREIELALLEAAAHGRELNAGQAEMVRDLAGCGARVRLALAPAGSGKTTALGVLTRAWVTDGGVVRGLAPSAQAAGELAAATGGHGDTVAILTHALRHGGELPAWAAEVDDRALIVIDEAGMTPTRDLAAVIGWAQSRGASVRLVGDDRQLAAIETGGILRDLDAEVGSVGLRELMRFSSANEAAATLAAREGRHEAIAFYLDHGRVTLSDPSLLADAAFDGWARDHQAGHDSLMLAATRAEVTELNRRARELRLENTGTEPGDAVMLVDGNTASAGDTIVTRQNDRRLRSTSSDWVKNGDRWEVVAVHEDGAVTARHLRAHRRVELPADYVAEHVQLGYASTIHAAQGSTVDTTHTVLNGDETRELFYVAVSRGRHHNQLYVAAAETEDHPWEASTIPPTTTDILTTILDREGAQQSARTSARIERDPATVLARSAGIYADAVAAAALHQLGPDRVQQLHDGAEAVREGLTDELAWDTLLAHLAYLELSGEDSLAALAAAAAQRPLDGVRDAAAVLDWRLDPTQTQGLGEGPLPWLRPVPPPLRDHPGWGPYLAARGGQLQRAAGSVWQHAHDLPAAERPRWAADLTDPGLLAEIAVWRAAQRIPEGDETPLGPSHPRANERRYQQWLARRLGDDTVGQSWVDQLTRIDPRITDDPWWSVLARRLDRAAAAGCDVPAALTAAAQLGPLPDDLPAASVWSRVAGDLGAGLTPRPGHSRLRPAFTEHLIRRLPLGVGDQLVGSAAWPGLVQAIRRAADNGHDIDLVVNDAIALTPVLTDGADLAAALTGRVDELVDGPPESEVAGEVDQPGVIEPIDDTEAVADSHPVEGLVEATADPQQRARIIELTEQAAVFYAGHYRGSSAAAYVRGRFGDDLTGDPRITIGYAPAGWATLTDHLTSRGATPAEVVDAGLGKYTRGGRVIDVFRDRVVVGIRDSAGELVGFSGRAAPGNSDPRAPKYLNTPATSVFRKGALLYGYAENADRLTAGAVPVRVEGVFDAIAITRATGGRAVGLAPMGTALTSRQAELIAAAAGDRPVLEATDTDAAGRAAAAKDFTTVTEYGLDLRRLVLVDRDHPDQPINDPAEAVERDGGRAIAAAVDTLEVAPTLTSEIVTDTLTRISGRLRERVDTRVLAAREIGRLIAAGPPTGWETEIDQAARLLADHAGEPDAAGDYYRDLVTGETTRAAADWLPAGTVDRTDLTALAGRRRTHLITAQTQRLQASRSTLLTRATQLRETAQQHQARHRPAAGYDHTPPPDEHQGRRR